MIRAIRALAPARARSRTISALAHVLGPAFGWPRLIGEVRFPGFSFIYSTQPACGGGSSAVRRPRSPCDGACSAAWHAGALPTGWWFALVLPRRARRRPRSRPAASTDPIRRIKPRPSRHRGSVRSAGAGCLRRSVTLQLSTIEPSLAAITGRW